MECHQQSTRTNWGFLLPFVFLAPSNCLCAEQQLRVYLPLEWLDGRCVLTDRAWSQSGHVCVKQGWVALPGCVLDQWPSSGISFHCPLAEGYSGAGVAYPATPGFSVSTPRTCGFVRYGRGLLQVLSRFTGKWRRPILSRAPRYILCSEECLRSSYQ